MLKKEVPFHCIDGNLVTLQNVILRKKNIWKSKEMSGSLPQASGSKGVTKIKWKEREPLFHPYFI